MINRTLRAGSAIAVALGSLLAAGLAFAQDATPPSAAEPAAAVAPHLDSGHTAWILVSTALVLMMTIPGLALFYAGMVRKKNILATMLQSFVITCLVTVLWFVVGYSLAFHGDNPYFGDLSALFLQNLIGPDQTATVGGILWAAGADANGGAIPESVNMMFQMTFAIITPALITGAFADRMKFSAVIVFSVLWALIVYCTVAHWVWAPGGWLGTKLGVLDYAGGTVVHINAGIAGLIGCLMIGKRKGYGHENFAPHNLAYTLIGASLLWVGWFGFNAGSALTADGRAAMAMVTTQIATAVAALAWMFVEWAAKGKPSALGLASGAVAGLVAITPAAGFVGPEGAAAIGLAAGVVCFWTATSLKNKLGYDDSLDAFGVHGIGGIIGALLTGVFALKEVGGTAGLLQGNPGQLLIQAEGVGIVIVFNAVVSVILYKLVDLTIGLRVTLEEEVDGLDISLHGETVH
jgi:Amt family ammonium transporter